MSYYSDILRLGFHEIQKAKAIAAMPRNLFTDDEQAMREMDEDCTLRAPPSRLRLIQGEIT